MSSIRLAVASVALGLSFGLQAAPGDQPVKPLPGAQPSAAAKGKSNVLERKASLPAKGLFVGDQLSESAKARLTELILNALSLQVQVALVVPTGPWQLDGSGKDERDLTPARLNAVKRYLSERGVDPKAIVVESRVDEKIKEPRLDLQILGRSATD
jgi:OmpA-OmpF porin, OOP family